MDIKRKIRIEARKDESYYRKEGEAGRNKCMNEGWKKGRNEGKKRNGKESGRKLKI